MAGLLAPAFILGRALWWPYAIGYNVVLQDLWKGTFVLAMVAVMVVLPLMARRAEAKATSKVVLWIWSGIALFAVVAATYLLVHWFWRSG